VLAPVARGEWGVGRTALGIWGAVRLTPRLATALRVGVWRTALGIWGAVRLTPRLATALRVGVGRTALGIWGAVRLTPNPRRRSAAPRIQDVTPG
jgi:hypothetical protein